MEKNQEAQDFAPSLVSSAEIQMALGIDFPNAVERFFVKRIGLPFHRLILKEPSPLLLSEERTLLFFNPQPGILVMRAVEGFEMVVGESLSGLDSIEKRPAALETLMVLFWHYFALKHWGLKTTKIRSALIRKSNKKNCVTRKPTASCGLILCGQPLEIRLWCPVSEDETRIW